MELTDLLRYVVDVLEKLSIPYLVTGSTATIAFGEPRFTNDVDIVIDLKSNQVDSFCQSFPKDEFYLNESTVRDAVKQKRQFNVIHPSSGLKVDFIIRKETPFDDSCFERAQQIRPATDFDALFASPEDVIIKKMDYYRMGGSEKHLRDITGVLNVSGHRIDFDYIENWAGQLKLEDIWQAILNRIDRPIKHEN